MTTQLALSPAQRHQATSEAIRIERRKLLDFIRRRVPSEADAEDILQDVFYQFANAMQDGVITQTTAWLYRVAGNRIIDWYRKKKTENFSQVNAAMGGSEDGEFDIEDMIFDLEDGPEAVLERELIWDEITAALDELPTEQREAFVQQEMQGRSFREMSAETGTPINTLISRKRYAVLFLRERLQDLYDNLF
ncbi:MAG: sigma-70 family RNA polymerase sigma factor [Bacteroidetes bacterium]|nr:sigma-70 family RNA polymerase sigma factor [Bacteroidota bacterium]